jgi:hypothetical protein
LACVTANQRRVFRVGDKSRQSPQIIPVVLRDAETETASAAMRREISVATLAKAVVDWIAALTEPTLSADLSDVTNHGANTALDMMESGRTFMADHIRLRRQLHRQRQRRIAEMQPLQFTTDRSALDVHTVSNHGFDIMSKTANGPDAAVLHAKQRCDVDLGLNGDLTLFESGQRLGG